MASSASVHLEGDVGDEEVGEEVGEVGVEGDDSSDLNKDLGGVTGVGVAVLAADGCGDGVAIRASSRSFLDFGGDEIFLGGAGMSSHFVSASTLLLTADVCDSSSPLQTVEEARSIRSEDELEAEMEGTMGGGEALVEVLVLLVTETVAEGTLGDICGT